MNRRASTAAVIAVAAAALLYLTIARVAFEGFPYSGDEYSYALQGQIFGEGRLSVPAPAHREWLQVDHVIVDDRVRTKYPPGWPALIAPFARAGVSWAANPVVAAATLLLLMGVSRRLCGDRGALVSTLMVAFSPFYVLNAASFHSHPSSLLGGALMLYGVTRAAFAEGDRRAGGWAALAGAGIGVAFLVRPVDGLVFGLGLLPFVRKPRLLVPALASSAAFAAAMLVYNALQFGSPFTTGYAVYEPLLRDLYGDSNSATSVQLYNLARPIAYFRHLEWAVAMNDMTVPGAIALALFGALTRFADAAKATVRVTLLTVTAGQLLVIMLSMKDYGEGYGPRYMFPFLLPLSAFAAVGFERARAALGDRLSARTATLIVAGLLAVGAVRIATYTERFRDDLDRRMSLSKTVAARGLSGAVVIVKTDFPTRYARNGPHWDGPVVYVAPRGASDETVAEAYAGRAVWVAQSEDHDARWNLRQVR